MKIDRIMGVILSIIVVLLLIGRYKDNNRDSNPFEINSTNGSVSLNNVNYDAVKFDGEVNSNANITEYVNKLSYKVTLSNDSISTSCTGVTHDDEILAESNYIVKAYFSYEKNGELFKSIDVEPGQKVYIHVISSYEGKYPVNEVSCNYNVGIYSA